MGFTMLSKIKSAVIVTASVLAVIYVANMFSPTSKIVSRALTPKA